MPDGAAADKSITAQRLRSFIQRVERLNEERKALLSDVNEVYGEAKSAGFDTKIMKKVVQLRKMDKAQRAEQDALIGVYLEALED